MLGSIKRRAEYRDYARAIDGCLKLLFYNFPEGTLERLRPTLNVEDTAWETFSRKDKNITANECGVMIARTLLGTYLRACRNRKSKPSARRSIHVMALICCIAP